MPQRSRSNESPKPGPDDGNGGPSEAAAFIAAALVDLTLMSRRHGLDTLGYLLDMAHMEAEDILHFRGDPKA